MSAFDFDPYSAVFRADPYAALAEMRRRAPIHYDEAWDLTFFTRHRDVTGLLRDRRLGRDALHVLDESELRRASPILPEYPLWTRFNRALSFIDLEPPDHTRLRGLVSRAFTRGRAEALRPRMEAVAAAAVDQALAAGAMDVVQDLAVPVPLTIICELLGIPIADGPQLLEWSHAIVRLYELKPGPGDGAAAERATGEFVDYLRAAVRQRRSHAGNDLLSALIEVEEHGDRLTEDELIATTMLLLNAGHEATVHAIGNAVAALAAHPGEYARLRGRPDLARTAVEELLRYDTPLQMFERWVLTDLDWDGVALRRGTKVGLLMGAANRDPSRFGSPDALDLARRDNPHVSFGGGIHHCLGAPLARLEMEAALTALSRRVPELVPAGPVTRHDSFVFRGLTSLVLHV